MNDKNLSEKFKLAENLSLKKEYEKSIINYKEILEFNPDFIPALNNIGLCYEYLNQFNDAEKYYSRCFFLKPDDIIFLNNLSNIYLKQKKFELALPLLKKSLEKNQDQIRVINLTVMCLIDLNKREEAEKFSNDKLKFFSDNRLLNKLHGRNLIYLNKHKQGLNFLKKGTGFLELEGKNIRILSY